jgi:hypothetical protein
MKSSTTKQTKALKNKPRNAGTMTESAFWSMIRSCLRMKSRWWVPIQKAKQEAKRKYTGTNKRQKFEYLCNQCKKYFPEKSIEVNHKIPAGTLSCGDDLKGFVERLFCEDGFEVVCKECHAEITKKQRIQKESEKS